MSGSGWLVLVAFIGAVLYGFFRLGEPPPAPPPRETYKPTPKPSFDASSSENRLLNELFEGDDSGTRLAQSNLPRSLDPQDLEAVKAAYRGLGRRVVAKLSARLPGADAEKQLRLWIQIAVMYLYGGDNPEARDALAKARALVEPGASPLHRYLADVLFMQGVTALRTGETENCVAHHCQSSCILPIDPKAVHGLPAGSRDAIRYFEDYLELHPRDCVGVWLLNIAVMTLGQYPQGVPEQYRIPPAVFTSKLDIGRFRDIAAEAGVNKVDISGGGIMDDFDGDGLLDIVESSHEQGTGGVFYRNRGDRTFEEMAGCGLEPQWGALRIDQSDAFNDGLPGVFFSRGGWEPLAVRHSLMRNDLDGTFSDVTGAANLRYPMTSQCSTWADFDNDGLLDVFCGGERDRNRLYRNKGDGTFEEIAISAGVAGLGGPKVMCKGAHWGDYDNDGWPDLLVANRGQPPQLFHNNHDSTFTDVSGLMRIDKPINAFPCWFFDYDNDGWLDVYVGGYEAAGIETAKAMMGQKVGLETGHLYHNLGGKGFEDVTEAAGLDTVILPMGSNFGDFDNDGFLDLYLATGTSPYSMIIPNRMFKNVDGKRFVDISYSSGTAHLQKGHQVACGDFDRDGDVDIFAQMGGAAPGDVFANALFENPGQGNHSVTVRLVGTRSNRAAVGARVKVVPAGEPERAMYRWVTSGSSFGGNPLEMTIGLAKATRVARLEVYWPTTGRTQVFRDLPVDTSVLVTEGEALRISPPGWLKGTGPTRGR